MRESPISLEGGLSAPLANFSKGYLVQVGRSRTGLGGFFEHSYGLRHDRPGAAHGLKLAVGLNGYTTVIGGRGV